MDETMRQYFKEFLTLCGKRLEVGDKTHHNAYLKSDLYQQMSEELADISNYAFLEYMKIQNLKKMKDKLQQDKH